MAEASCFWVTGIAPRAVEASAMELRPAEEEERV